MPRQMRRQREFEAWRESPEARVAKVAVEYLRLVVMRRDNKVSALDTLHREDIVVACPIFGHPPPNVGECKGKCVFFFLRKSR